MSNKNRREITYYDVSPYAALSANGTTYGGGIQDFSVPRKLFAENMVYRGIQTCEHNYTVLDGEHREFAENENIALWSKQQSQYPSRLLPQSVTLDVSFGGLQSGPGIAFYFDLQNNVWCDMLRVKWYRDGTLLSDKTFEPDSAAYSCVNRVDLYNRVVIEFIRLNMAGRYLRLEAVLFGIIRVFGDGEIENFTINEGCDPTGRTMYINSANFTINTKDPLPYLFLKRQPLHIRYYAEKSSAWLYMGLYYIDKSKRYADKRYSVEAVDKIGVLDVMDDFMGGVYDSIYNIVTAETLIKQIIPAAFDIEIDGSLKNKQITGWLPIMKRREALAQISLAIGAIINTSRASCIEVKPMPAPGNIKHTINKDRVYQSGSVAIEFPYTGIELTEHNFTIGNTTKELYSDTFAGEKLVKFSQPASNLTITNGTILEYGTNYAVIKSTGETIKCVLSGKEYIDNQSLVTLKTPNLIEGTQEKTEKIENCYLVNKDNSQAAAQRLYNYYLRRSVFDGDFLIDADTDADMEKIGDTVKIATVFEDEAGQGYISGQIEKLSLRLGNKNIKARGNIRGG